MRVTGKQSKIFLSTLEELRIYFLFMEELSYKYVDLLMLAFNLIKMIASLSLVTYSP